MKKTFTLILSSFSLFAFAQTQIVNAGFETWDNVGTSTEEPGDFNSNKTGSSTAQIGPQTCFRDGSIKHGGSYALRLENKTVPIIGTVVNGNATTGVINAPSTNKADGYIGTVNYSSATDIRRLAFTGRPDSIVGWYQYTSGGTGEQGKITAILHNNQYFDPETPITNHPDPTADKIARATFLTPTGSNNTWTRFTAPFVYTSAGSPTYIMLNMTPSNNQLTTFSGSKIWIDDIYFIYNPPIVSFTTSTTKCVGSPISFTDQSTNGPTSWNWSFPGGTPNSSTSQNPIITYTAAGTYSATLIAANGSTSVPVTQTFVVNALPSITVNSPTICALQSATLTASGATSYTWNTGANTSSISVTPSVTANYTVTGVNAQSCVNYTTASVMVSVVNLSVNSETICIGGTSTLTAIGATTYTWNTGDNTASIVVSPTVATNYTVSGANSFGCIGTTTTNISITNSPVISVNSPTICSGQTATLTASGVSSYTWNTGSNNASITVSPLAPTNYTISGQASGCSVTVTATASVMVNATPTVVLAPITNTYCAGDPAITLNGTPGGGIYSGVGVSGNSFNPSAAGTFTVTYMYTNSSNCSASESQTINVNTCVGINELSVNAISIYPNPVNDELFVNLTQLAASNKTIEVYDVIGKKIISINSIDNIVLINTGELNKGVYVMKIQTENAKFIVTRFIKN